MDRGWIEDDPRWKFGDLGYYHGVGRCFWIQTAEVHLRWPENLRRKMERGEVAQEDEERAV